MDTVIGFWRRKILAKTGFYVDVISLHTEERRNRAVKAKGFIYITILSEATGIKVTNKWECVEMKITLWVIRDLQDVTAI